MHPKQKKDQTNDIYMTYNTEKYGDKLLYLFFMKLKIFYCKCRIRFDRLKKIWGDVEK